MLYSTAAFTWIAGHSGVVGVTIETNAVIDGVCYSAVFFRSPAARVVFGVTFFLIFYVDILLIFIFCYGRILVTIRRQASVIRISP